MTAPTTGTQPATADQTAEPTQIYSTEAQLRDAYTRIVLSSTEPDKKATELAALYGKQAVLTTVNLVSDSPIHSGVCVKNATLDDKAVTSIEHWFAACFHQYEITARDCPVGKGPNQVWKSDAAQDLATYQTTVTTTFRARPKDGGEANASEEWKVTAKSTVVLQKADEAVGWLIVSDSNLVVDVTASALAARQVQLDAVLALLNNDADFRKAVAADPAAALAGHIDLTPADKEKLAELGKKGTTSAADLAGIFQSDTGGW